MAVGMLVAGEGVTRDMYVLATEKMFGTYPMPAEQAPDGLIVHTAGETPEGWYIYDVWESKEHFMRFMDDMVGPAMKEMGAAETAGPQFFEIETIVSPA